jgi:peroxiredoxin
MTSVLNVALTLGFVALAAGSWLGWQLLRQNGRVLLRLDALEKRLDELEFDSAGEPAGLSLDSPAPGFELPDLAGERHSLVEYRNRLLLLIFFNPTCGFCRELAPRLAGLLNAECRLQNAEVQRAIAGNGNSAERPLVVIISMGDAEANRQLFDEHKVNCPALLQKEMEVATAYGANGTPSGYLISPEGKIASELALGAEALLALAAGQSEARHPNSEMDRSPALNAEPDGRINRFRDRSLARSKLKRDGLKAGTPATGFRLPRLDGHGDLSLDEFRGRQVLLVFSSPHCGPCNTLAPKLQKFHRKHPDVSVVMISRGEPAENHAKVKEHRLTFPVVLQQQWEISRQYAMFATPVAYLIDENGVIAHDVAVGVEAILELMAGVTRGTKQNQLTSSFTTNLR